MGKVLIITQRVDPTVDRMVMLFHERGIPFERFHPEDIPVDATLSIELASGRRPTGTIQAAGVDLRWDEITSVWYRRPERPVLPEALSEEEKEFAFAETTETVFGLWRVLDAFWVNHPDRTRRAASKPLQLAVAVELGLAIPPTLFTNDPERLRAFADAARGPIVYKAMTQGYLGVSTQEIIYTSRLEPEHLDQAELLRRAPGIFQEEVPKRYDLRVTVVGRRAFAVEIHSQDEPQGALDWRRNQVPRMKHVPHELPQEVEHACLAMMDRFDLQYAAIDLILDRDGAYVFLEINPSGQFGWIEDFTGLPIFASLADLLVEERA